MEVEQYGLGDEVKFFDIYGIEIARQMLRIRGYSHVSVRKKSVPSLGSPTFNIDKIKFNDDLIVKRTIRHKNGNVTIVTNKAYFQFIKI